MSKETVTSVERRSILTGLNAGAAALAGFFLGGAGRAQAQTSAAPAQGPRWQPATYDKDSWLDVPSKHRLLFDTVDATGAGEAFLFAGNFFRVSKSEYGVDAGDISIIVVVRHDSVVFGYNDAMWARYGGVFAERIKFYDPKTGATPKINVYNGSGYGDKAANLGTTQESLAKQGAKVAVCAMATRAVSGAIARATGGKQDDIIAELSQNLVSNARLVPAGIVTVGRAQEHGYSLVKA